MRTIVLLAAMTLVSYASYAADTKPDAPKAASAPTVAELQKDIAAKDKLITDKDTLITNLRDQLAQANAGRQALTQSASSNYQSFENCSVQLARLQQQMADEKAKQTK